MKLKDLFEARLVKQDMMMGLTMYEGKGYTLAGGWRSGSSPAGLSRLKYDIYDMTKYTEDANPKDYKAGFIEINVDGRGVPEGLIDIEILPKFRSSPSISGRKIVNDLIDTAGGTINIYDVQKKAVGFWEKMGIEWLDRSKTRGVIKR